MGRCIKFGFNGFLSTEHTFATRFVLPVIFFSRVLKPSVKLDWAIFFMIWCSGWYFPTSKILPHMLRTIFGQRLTSNTSIFTLNKFSFFVRWHFNLKMWVRFKTAAESIAEFSKSKQFWAVLINFGTRLLSLALINWNDALKLLRTPAVSGKLLVIIWATCTWMRCE